MKKIKFILFVVLNATLISCSDDAARQETIDKLRALGVVQVPTIATPGATVQLTYYLGGPKGLTVTPTPYNDSEFFKYGTNADVTLIDATPVEEIFGNSSLYTFQASFIAPATPEVSAVIAAKGNARLRYGVDFRTPSGDYETVIADALIYSPTAPQTEWVAQTVDISLPSTTAISGSTAIQGEISSPLDEPYKVGWFVSSGKVKVRNAIKTEWSEIGSGEQTLIFTARGSKSGAFAIKVLKVNVN
jgi:hypothetical protein